MILLNDSNIEQQYFAKAGADICQLLAPLKRHGIIHFAHVRSGPKVKHMFTSHPEFSVLFFKSRFQHHVFAADPSRYESGVTFLEDMIETSTNTDVLKNIKQACMEQSHFIPGLTYTEKHGDTVDFFWFGTSVNTPYSKAFYVERLHLFKQYLNFFKDAGKDVLQACYANQLIMNGGDDLTSMVSETVRKQIDLSSQVNLQNELKNTRHFSSRERLVACYLYDGCSPKEIARKLNSSVRTIEKQIASLRKKMQSRSVSHLIAQLNQQNWMV